MVCSSRRLGQTISPFFKGQAVQELLSYRRLRENLSVPSARMKQTASPLQMGPIGYPKTSVRNYHSTLRKIPKEHNCHLAVPFH